MGLKGVTGPTRLHYLTAATTNKTILSTNIFVAHKASSSYQFSVTLLTRWINLVSPAVLVYLPPE